MPAPVSVIVTTLNSEDDLLKLSTSLFVGLQSSLIRELVISDGGSTDGTLALAGQLGARVTTGTRGRGFQLASGARAADGDWLLFLHADTVLADGWVDSVENHIETAPDKAAHFRLAFAERGVMPRVVAAWANFRSAAFGLPYGDQGLLIPRDLYWQLGGYPEVRLFEDVEIARLLKGQLRALPVCAITDARRYVEEGWTVRGSRNLVTLARYFMGTSPEILADAYYRPRSKRQGALDNSSSNSTESE